jgi:hypothetical protein
MSALESFKVTAFVVIYAVDLLGKILTDEFPRARYLGAYRLLIEGFISTWIVGLLNPARVNDFETLRDGV